MAVWLNDALARRTSDRGLILPAGNMRSLSKQNAGAGIGANNILALSEMGTGMGFPRGVPVLLSHTEPQISP